MDSIYFLHTKSLSNNDYQTYKSGLLTLNALAEELLDDEKVNKSFFVYDSPLYIQLCEDCSETRVILKFIEQCPTVDVDIDSDSMFNSEYPLCDVGFWGINFDGILNIAPERQIIDYESLSLCRSLFFARLIMYGNDNDFGFLLKRRFPQLCFTNEAQEDLLWWKHTHISFLDGIIRLLDDIPAHPFTGGLGKTEVLSNTTNTVSSKRITHEDRLSYTFDAKMITIHRCKGHYCMD